MVSYLRDQDKPLLCGAVMADGATCARKAGHSPKARSAPGHQSRAFLDAKNAAERTARASGEYVRSREWTRNKAAERTQFLDSYKLERGCADCKYAKFAGALEFDHLPGTDKVAPVGNMRLSSMDRLLAEIAKCEVVCANCHRERTAKRGQFKPYGPNRRSQV